MSATTKAATIHDLLKVEGKAELIAGRIVPLMPAGFRPGRIGGRIFRELDDHTEATGIGVAHTGTMGFAVPELTTGRQSFSPDVSYDAGPPPSDPMRFVEGPPTFAVEVRSENDFGPAAERAMAAKRAEYFEAGTLVVWDVDPIAALIRSYRADAPDRPSVFARGSEADAEPALPGWRLAVDRALA